MVKKKNSLTNLFSWLTYKEKPDTAFFIPEVDTTSPSAESRKFEKGRNSPASADGKSDEEHRVDKKLQKRTFIKPLPAIQAKKLNPAKSSEEPSGNMKNSPSQKQKDSVPDKSSKGNVKGEDESKSISAEIETNIEDLRKAFNSKDNKDVIYRRFCIADGVNAFLFFVDGMVSKEVINLSILQPLLERSKYKDLQGKNLFDYVYDSVIETNQMSKADTQEAAIIGALAGDTGIFIDGYPYYILCETKGFEKRSVEKPQVEGVVKGAQEAFNENLRTNITLLRRILKNRELTTCFIDLGKRNNEKFAVLYINKLVNPALVSEVLRRMKSIETDLIMSDGILEQFIEDHPLSIFPTVLSTERPDRAVSHLVEGKVAILTDGSPFALIVPVTIADFLHTPEDTTLRWPYGTFLRLIRLFAFFVATMLPGTYVALTTFHGEMIPTDLLIAIAKARENVPFPTIAEVLLMEVSFELIREAGIRIPGIIGNTIGIIGALILGQAAVQANLVSPVLIIIVAFTGLGNFAIPDFSLAFGARIIRIFFIILGASLGFYGISLGILIVFALTVSLNSFGVPIFSTIAPKTKRSFDFFIRWPVWKQERRPDYLNPLDIRRQPKISRKWIKSKPNKGKPGRKDKQDEQ